MGAALSKRPIQCVGAGYRMHREFFVVSRSNPLILSSQPVAKVMDFVLQGSRIDYTATSATESFGIPSMFTEKMQRLSPSLKILPQLLPEDVKKWIAHWKRIGFLGDPPLTRL